MRLNKNNKFKILILSDFNSDDTEFKPIEKLKAFTYNPKNKKVIIMDDSNNFKNKK